jgi:hypothetical protein
MPVSLIAGCPIAGHLELLPETVAALAQAVVDAFDAMTSDRSYRPALSLDAALAEIGAKAGTQFAPDCARAFLRLRPWFTPGGVGPGG